MTETENKLFIAVATTIFTQISISGIGQYRRWRDKKLKQALIIQDLSRHKQVLGRLRAHYISLSLKFRKDDLDIYVSSAFQDLHSDVFNSVEKTALYSIFKKDLPDVIGTYKVFDFLKENIPQHIYNTYIDRWSEHRDSDRHIVHGNRNFKCAYHDMVFKMAKDSIHMNLNTIRTVTIDMDKIIKKYK